MSLEPWESVNPKEPGGPGEPLESVNPNEPGKPGEPGESGESVIP